MKLKKLALYMGVIGTLVFGLMACKSGNNISSAGGNVIKIGISEPLSGENGTGGTSEMLGIRYANQMYPTVTIGDTEYKIELVEVDNKSDKKEALKASQKLIKENVSLVLGSYGSGVSMAAKDTYAEANIPVIGISCTNPDITLGNDFYFRICYTDEFQGMVMANYASQVGSGKVAIISAEDDEYSSGLGTSFANAIGKFGGEAVSNEQFKSGQKDFKDILSRVKEANPDFIFIPSSADTGSIIIKQAREMGINSVIGAGDTWENTKMISDLGANAEGIVFSTFYDADVNTADESADIIAGFKNYLTENKQDETVTSVSVLGYDAYLVAYNAIASAGSNETGKIKEALESTNVDGLTGKIIFDENGDANKNIAFIKTVENGEIKLINKTEIQ